MMFGTSFPLLKSAHIDSDRSQQQRLADRLDHLVAVNADHPEQLGDEHQQQDPRQALHHPLQRLLHHLVDRIVEIHSRQLVKEKTKGGDRGGGDDRRDQRGKEAETFGGTVSGILIFSPLRPSSQQ